MDEFVLIEAILFIIMKKHVVIRSFTKIVIYLTLALTIRVLLESVRLWWHQMANQILSAFVLEVALESTANLSMISRWSTLLMLASFFL